MKEFRGKDHKFDYDKIKKKRHCTLQSLLIAGIAILLCLSAVMLLVAKSRDQRASSSVPLPVEIYGEYSWDNVNWQPLSEDADLNALKGDLYVRGHFSNDFTGKQIMVYLDHIYYSISVNGEQTAGYIPRHAFDEPDVCGNDWSAWYLGDDVTVSSNDLIEIHLCNPHTAGNVNAYAEFLGNIYRGGSVSFNNFMLKSGLSEVQELRSGLASEINAPLLYSGHNWRVFGYLVLSLAVLLLGVALADSLQGSLLGGQLWYMALFAATMSGCMMLDTNDVILWSSSIVVNSSGAQLCRILAVFFLILCDVEFINGKMRRVVYGIAIADGIFDAGILLAGIFFKIPLCEMTTPWLIGQLIAILMLLVCMIIYLMHVKEKKDLASMIFVVLLDLVALLETVNAWTGWWSRGLVFNIAFLTSFAVVLIWIFNDVPAKYKAAEMATEMEQELSISRIAIMLSQIQPHFLYNALSTIRALCRRDPKQAEQAIIEFTEFLRGNMDSLTADKPVPFEQELEHTKHYLTLEEKRFPDKLRIVYDIGPTLFRMPTLSLQPIVENAVRYGVTKKVEGGTVIISTAETDNAYVITVKDDGMGFDPMETKEDGRTHIGISNVESRLKSMCNATLKIESKRDAGTTAVIEIPKGVETC